MIKLALQDNEEAKHIGSTSPIGHRTFSWDEDSPLLPIPKSTFLPPHQVEYQMGYIL